MGRRSFITFALAGISLISLSGCDAGPTIEFNFRLTVELETPEGVRTGSSVLKFWGRRRSSNKLDPYADGLGSRYRGEAVAVDLPNGQTLFALLNTEGGGDATRYLFLAFADEVRREKDITKGLELLQRLKGQTRSLPRMEMTLPNGGTEVSAYPFMVTFTDIANPTTIKRVDPADLAASFRAGYKLNSISVTITDDPMSTGLDKRFVWWRRYLDRHFDGSTTASTNLTSDDPTARFSARSFSTEFRRHNI